MVADGRPVATASVPACLGVLAALCLVLASSTALGQPQGAARTRPAIPQPASSLPPSAPIVVAAEPTPREAVEDIVARYRLAFSALDAAAAKAIWPSLDERSLAHAFRQLQSQELTFAECQTEMNGTGTRGTVTCRGSVRFTPRVGTRVAQVELRRWEFDVMRLAGSWRIYSVTSTADPQPR